NGLGDTAGLQGKYVQAVPFHRQALDVGREVGIPMVIIHALTGLARAADSLCQSERAARLFGAAEVRDASVGAMMMAPAVRAANERLVTNLRTALGEKAFAASERAGRAM